jgi:predicted flap endonuclease-1-like 5' DNA nuclease
MRFQESDELRHKLAEAEAENARLQALLAEAEAKAASVATLGAAATADTRFSSGQGSLSALAGLETPARQIPQRRDNLVDIDGIGPVYAKRLNEAGIVSFAQLAELTPDQIRAIIKPAEWQKIDAESWIAQAKRLSRPEELEKVVGIGEVFANRLKGAGIHTFRQLSQLTPDHVREIINPEDWHNIEPESWIAQAGYLANPDDLEEIDGIGQVYAGRLNEAGIYSFEQLTQLTPERIREIINPEEWQKIEPESWIAQAKEFVAKKSLTS